MDGIWVEKYRPKSFDEIAGQKEIVSRVRALIEQKNLPHLMFAGPAGVGKSTLALVLARSLFGESWKQNFLELNASDERGIDVVRVKVKDFARTRAIGDVPFKVIFLDECDALTKEAQQALRRTMENYAGTARFVLSCNYISKIIEPIQSRCVVFRFKPLLKADLAAVVANISRVEGFEIDDAAVSVLFDVCEGDCRRAENILQSCASVSKKIDVESIYAIAGAAQPKEIRQVLEFAVKGSFVDAKKLLFDSVLKYGLAGTDVIKLLQKEAWSLAVDDRVKLAIIDKCGEAEFRLVEGSDDIVQLDALLASISCLK